MATRTPGQQISQLPPGPFETLVKIKPSGSLQARKHQDGTVSLFWRYSIGTFSDRVLVGIYDASAPPKSLTPTIRGFSIAAATHKAEELANLHHANKKNGGYRALLEAEENARVQAEKIAEIEKQKKLSAEIYTLKKLLDEYCDYIEQLGRRSHKDARSIFRLHVFNVFTEYSSAPANQITGEIISDIMRRLHDEGKGRTANKLRSYIHAAYEIAKSARSLASIPLIFKNFDIKNNPAAETRPDSTKNKPDKNPLSDIELRTYWNIIKSIDGIKGGSLRLHLLTGGQRIAQLVRLLSKDISSDFITIYDAKGRPGTPQREHIIPLTTHISDALHSCDPSGFYALSTDSGRTQLSATTLSNWAVDAAKESIPNFNTKRIRSGVESLLAKARVSQDERGRLQSHGIAGVQNRHYNNYDYLKEKREALETLYKLLND